MSTEELERAAYIAAHAVLAANATAPYLACPGARRSYVVDVVADIIKSVFEMHCEEMDAFPDRLERPIMARFSTLPLAAQPARNRKVLPIRAETAVKANR